MNKENDFTGDQPTSNLNLTEEQRAVSKALANAIVHSCRSKLPGETATPVLRRNSQVNEGT